MAQVDVKHGLTEKEYTDDAAHNAASRGQTATDQYGQPLFQFDPVAERKLRLKIDLMIVPTVAMLYLFCFIDRANIGNARLAGLEKDLKLKNYDYNAVLSVFYVSYIVFEIPCNILCKKIGPGWFGKFAKGFRLEFFYFKLLSQFDEIIPATSLAFGICSLGTAFVHTFSQVCGVRFLLGIFEAGMLPGIAYYMSRWYRRSELAFRLSLYIVMAPLAGAFGGLLASGILTLSSVGSLTTWRMIFIIEGIITCGLSIIAFFTLTDRPSTAKWLTAEERELAIARVKSERVGTTVVLDKMDSKKLLAGIFNPVVLATSMIFLLDNVTVQGLAFFLPTIVRTIYPGTTIVHQQLRTVPPYVVGAFFTLMFPFLSWRFDRRNIFLIISAPLMMVGYIMFLASTDPQVRYGATFLITAGAFSFGALCNAQVSANVLTDTARASAIGTNVMFGNIGGLVSTWAFVPHDAPNYPIGNGLNLATSSTILILSVALMFYIKWDNKKRDQRNVDAELAGLNDEAREDLDWKHPGFRWRS